MKSFQISHVSLSRPARRPIRLGTLLRRIAERSIEQIFIWQERSRSRRLLGSLDDRMLRDVGVDRATAHEQAQKPFWR